MTALKRDDRHALLVTILTNVVPWVTPIAALGFLIAWVASIVTGASDDPALTLFLVLTGFTLYAWACRAALLGQSRDTDQKP